MAENNNEKELTTFGFVTKQLRVGLVTTIIGALITAVIVLFIKNDRLQSKMVNMQAELYEKIIREQVKPKLGEIQEQVTGVVNKVDTAVNKVDSFKTTQK